MNEQVLISIIIPVYNGSKYLNRCLSSILTSFYTSYEIIVVDDCSTDNSLSIAEDYGTRVYKLPCQSGPAAARNLGANQAKGDILLFLDSDIQIQKGTLSRFSGLFRDNPNISAVFGSYDNSPEEKDVVSQYKNLLHHYTHQHADENAKTFWAGCGAVRREVFQKVGGFDQKRYPNPSIEDIELGYRMKGMGYEILLDKETQVKHLKRWTLASLLRADIFYRAVPWSTLIFENSRMVNDLNLKTSQRVSAALAGLSILTLLFLFFKPIWGFSLFFLWGIILLLNYDLSRFFLRRNGFLFSIIAFQLHLLYFLYSGIVFVCCWIKYTFLPKQKDSATV